MTGSLQIKNDKYYMVLNTHDAQGKRKLKWMATDLPAKGNKKRAQKMLRDTLEELERKGLSVCCDLSFSEAIRQWLRDSALRVDPVTWQGYAAIAERHILPYFDAAKTKLVDVDRRVLQAYIDEKARSGRVDGTGGLSPTSIRRHKNILFQTLKCAVRDGILPRNPCEDITLPHQQRYEPGFFTAEQINAFLEAAQDEPLYPLLKVTAVYGLRRSEALGLKWDSVDFAAKLVTIRHTVVKVTTTVEKDKTKNTSSYRSFPLTPDIEKLLHGLKEKEQESRRLFGREYHDNDYIFKWDDGRPYDPDFVTKKFSELLKKYGFEHIRLHDLRHSCASMLIAMGFTLKDIQEWLGHADIQMTANVYSHLDVQRKKEIAGRLEKAVAAGLQC